MKINNLKVNHNERKLKMVLCYPTKIHGAMNSMDTGRDTALQQGMAICHGAYLSEVNLQLLSGVFSWSAFSIALVTSPCCWNSHWLVRPTLTGRYLYWKVSCKREKERLPCEWILTNQRAGNTHCGTVMSAFRRGRILTPIKWEWLYLFLSQLHQQTWIIIAGKSLKSGVFIDSTDMLYVPEFKSWELSNWHAKQSQLDITTLTEQIHWCKNIKRWVTTIILHYSKSTINDQRSGWKYTSKCWISKGKNWCTKQT